MDHFPLVFWAPCLSSITQQALLCQHITLLSASNSILNPENKKNQATDLPGIGTKDGSIDSKPLGGILNLKSTVALPTQKNLWTPNSVCSHFNGKQICCKITITFKEQTNKYPGSVGLSVCCCVGRYQRLSSSVAQDDLAEELFQASWKVYCICKLQLKKTEF